MVVEYPPRQCQEWTVVWRRTQPRRTFSTCQQVVARYKDHGLQLAFHSVFRRKTSTKSGGGLRLCGWPLVIGYVRISPVMTLSVRLAWILQCWKQEHEDQHWRTDLSEMQKCTKEFSIENLWERKMQSSISRIRWDSTSSKELRVFSSEILTISSSKQRRDWNGQVDRQVLTAPEASTRFLNGHVADVRHERTGHERLCPFSDNLTTLMFVVASEHSEAQRETKEWMSLLTHLKQYVSRYQA